MRVAPALIAVLVVAGCGNPGPASGTDDGNQADIHDDAEAGPEDAVRDEGHWSGYDVAGTDLGTYDAFVEEALSCNPNPIDFGSVPVGQSRTIDVVMTNTQSNPISITDLYLDIDADNFEIVDLDIGDASVLDHAGELAIQVSFSPDSQGARAANLTVVGLVGGRQQMWSFQITAVGTATSGSLEFLPELVDFGVVAIGKSKSMVMTVINNSDVAVTIRSVELNQGSAGESVRFEITRLGETLPPFEEEPFVTLNPTEFLPVEVKFTNSGPDSGEYSAFLDVNVSSPNLFTYSIPVIAITAHPGVCDARIVPATLDFGTIAVGNPVTLDVAIVNTGTGSCMISAGKIADCAPGPDETVTCPEVLKGSDSTVFFFDGELPYGLIGPGTQIQIGVTATIPLADDGVALSALLSFDVLDVTSQKSIVLPVCADGICPPNVSATGSTDE